MSFYNSGITLNDSSSGYNILTSSIVRPILSLSNLSSALSGYNVVLPAINFDNISTYRINGIDSSNTSSILYVGYNSSTIQIGSIKNTTNISGLISNIDSQRSHY